MKKMRGKTPALKHIHGLYVLPFIMWLEVTTAEERNLQWNKQLEKLSQTPVLNKIYFTVHATREKKKKLRNQIVKT